MMKFSAKNLWVRLSQGLLFIMICGWIGWVYETIFTSILWGDFCGFFARGLLHIPVCPIYGFFSLLLLAIFQIPWFRKLTGWKRILSAAVTGIIVSTLCELLASYLMEAILGEFLWSYEGWFLNFQGRISLPSSLLFGGLTLLLLTWVVPLFRKMTHRLPKAVTALLGTLCGIVMVTDLAITLL